MIRNIVLKDINFSEFKAKLEKKSQSLGYEITENGDKLILKWDNNWLGVGFEVEMYSVDNKDFIYVINLERLLRLVIILWLVLLIIFYGKIWWFLLSAVLLAVALYLSIGLQSDRNVRELFDKVMHCSDNEETMAKSKESETQGLVCPACGEPLTEYDEYCPRCGLYLGKVWKRQPASRTGFENRRLEYHFKKKTPEENQ